MISVMSFPPNSAGDHFCLLPFEGYETPQSLLGHMCCNPKHINYMKNHEKYLYQICFSQTALVDVVFIYLLCAIVQFISPCRHEYRIFFPKNMFMSHDFLKYIPCYNPMVVFFFYPMFALYFRFPSIPCRSLCH